MKNIDVKVNFMVILILIWLLILIHCVHLFNSRLYWSQTSSWILYGIFPWSNLNNRKDVNWSSLTLVIWSDSSIEEKRWISLGLASGASSVRLNPLVTLPMTLGNGLGVVFEASRLTSIIVTAAATDAAARSVHTLRVLSHWALAMLLALAGVAKNGVFCSFLSEIFHLFLHRYH